MTTEQTACKREIPQAVVAVRGLAVQALPSKKPLLSACRLMLGSLPSHVPQCKEQGVTCMLRTGCFLKENNNLGGSWHRVMLA